jgi:hypothetical protein
MNIFIIRTGQEQEGPFSPEEINVLIMDGSLSPEALAWYDGLTEWIIVKDIPKEILHPSSGIISNQKVTLKNQMMLAGNKVETNIPNARNIGYILILGSAICYLLYNNNKELESLFYLSIVSLILGLNFLFLSKKSKSSHKQEKQAFDTILSNLGIATPKENISKADNETERLMQQFIQQQQKTNRLIWSIGILLAGIFLILKGKGVL